MRTSLQARQSYSDKPSTGHSPVAAEIGTLPFIAKSVRFTAQLLLGLLQIRKLGVPAECADNVALSTRSLALHRLCRSLLRHLEVEVVVEGTLPCSGLLVTNHVSFLDIIFLGAVTPMVFVSKSDVAAWPVVGTIASCAGTVFVERRRRLDVSRVNSQVSRALNAGTLVTLFPEGTSSDGSRVLPFQPSLLQPAVEAGISITPGYLRYTGLDGERADDIAYFGDRDLMPCIIALLNRRKTTATLRCAPPLSPATDRKTLASQLHAAVVGLSEHP